MTSRAARPDAMRRHNLSLVLAEVHAAGELTRAELTHRLGMSRSTIGALVAELTDLGLVSESVPSGGDRVGRPSHVVGPSARGPFVVAIDIDVTHITVAAIGIGGTVLHRRTVQTGPVSPSPASMAALIAAEVGRVAEAVPSAAGVIGVGVSVPGTVDRHSGLVGVAPNLGWHDAAFGDLLTEAMHRGAPVEVGNDADLAVLAEHRRGSGRGSEDVIYLMGRVGVGAGIISGGVPLRGHDGHAGEIGHTVIEAGGPPCHCGKAGCTETYIGEGALLTLAHRPLPPTDDAVSDVFAAARSGDAVALLAVRTVAGALGRAVAGLVNMLNPERVLLGGSFSHVLELARPEIERALETHVLEAPARSLQLDLPAFGPDSALLGAAEIGFAALLADPLVAASMSA
ncbi:MAG TPA: ROK family transcriptional regulator [Jatrophihabitans sp.]|uniref:ROK family transcriptional regulator n=1 Tax=Jatrophihabitans sp. TaxID=1932789 RepID=UPI002E09EADD|nr:ROK family transcriptional regulator [Jatrophihabitans sp.]